MQSETHADRQERTAPLRWYGWVGLVVLLVAEYLLIRDNVFIKQWFTPIMWSAYIVLLDAVIFKLRGNSLITNRPLEFLFMLPYSVLCWLIFEGYNFYLQNWAYHGLQQNIVLRSLGFVWAFATIFPGVLLTSEVIDLSGLFSRVRVKAVRLWRGFLYTCMIFGLLCLIVPLVVSQDRAVYLFGLVWIGFVFVLDPMNYFLGARSLFGDLERGRIDKLLSLFLAGALCGFLWEFWNYWATTRWTYTFPYLTEPKIFEMPLVGFLGFLPFAVEIYAMWAFMEHILRRRCASA